MWVDNIIYPEFWRAESVITFIPKWRIQRIIDLRDRWLKIRWKAYILESLKQLMSWKNIMWEEIPYQIKHNIKLLSETDIKEILAKINTELQIISSVERKRQLMLLRNELLITLRN